MLYFETIGSRLSLMLLTMALQFGTLNCSRRRKVKKNSNLDAKKPIPVVMPKTPKPSPHAPVTNISPYNAMQSPLVKTIPKTDREEKIAKGKMVRRQSDFPAMQNQNLSDSLRSSVSSDMVKGAALMNDDIDQNADIVPTGIKKVMSDRAKESKNKGGKKPAKKTTAEKLVTCDDDNDDRYAPNYRKMPDSNDNLTDPKQYFIAQKYSVSLRKGLQRGPLRLSGGLLAAVNELSLLLNVFFAPITSSSVRSALAGVLSFESSQQKSQRKTGSSSGKAERALELFEDCTTRQGIRGDKYGKHLRGGPDPGEMSAQKDIIDVCKNDSNNDGTKVEQCVASNDSTNNCSAFVGAIWAKYGKTCIDDIVRDTCRRYNTFVNCMEKFGNDDLVLKRLADVAEACYDAENAIPCSEVTTPATTTTTTQLLEMGDDYNFTDYASSPEIQNLATRIWNINAYNCVAIILIYWLLVEMC
ncbi:hypothetical protein Ddc_11934 [Ditylenchus destructor]|nr:hypothetical protein Ddc_11934 [Ditylenchus destructor]